MEAGSPFRLLREALSPLDPVLAQLLWFTQPMFGLLGEYHTVGRLAERLYNEDGTQDQTVED